MDVPYAFPEHVVRSAEKLQKELKSSRPLVEICKDLSPAHAAPPATPKPSLRDALIDALYPFGIKTDALAALESVLKEYSRD